MTFSDPDILGFYTSRMYIKHNSQGQLVFYMQKGEVVDMLKEDGSISSSYMSVIKAVSIQRRWISCWHTMICLFTKKYCHSIGDRRSCQLKT